MIQERSKSKFFPSETYISLDDKVYDADVIIKFPLDNSKFST